jgi:hypothetical protein
MGPVTVHDGPGGQDIRVLKSEGIGGGTPGRSGCGLPEAMLRGNQEREGFGLEKAPRGAYL